MDIGMEHELDMPSSIPAQFCFVQFALIPLDREQIYLPPAMG